MSRGRATILVEKKKTYEFVGKENAEEISLSDEFLGNKIRVKKITLITDHKHIYSMACEYDQQGSSL